MITRTMIIKITKILRKMIINKKLTMISFKRKIMIMIITIIITITMITMTIFKMIMVKMIITKTKSNSTKIMTKII